MATRKKALLLLPFSGKLDWLFEEVFTPPFLEANIELIRSEKNKPEGLISDADLGILYIAFIYYGY